MSISSSKRKFENWITISVFIVASLLRLILCSYNKVANDNHLEVSTFFLQGLSQGYFPPEFQSCWECYHAKLYHYVCALLFHFFKVESELTQILIAQYLNAGAGVFTLIVIYAFLKQLPIAWLVRVCAFTLVALNPSFIAINIQATNDSFAILFGVLTTYWLLRQLVQNNLKSLIFCTCFMIFYLLTKGSALILLPLVFGSLLVQAITSLFKNTPLLLAVRPLVISSLAIIFVGLMPSSISPYRQYFERMWAQSSLGAVNFEKKSAPLWFDRTYVGRPGVISIADSYFTFRFVDMLQTPYITQDQNEYPLHRTSLWSQLYGRYHYVFFDQWPWARKDQVSILLGRISLIFGLIPTLVFLYGASVDFLKVAREMRTFGKAKTLSSYTWVLPVEIISFLALIVVFTFEHRGFESMKVIYILPGYLAFLNAYCSGLSRSYELLAKRPRALILLFTSQVLLFFSYLANSYFLLTYLM